MNIIYKYKLEITKEQTVEIPKYHKILCVQVQNNEVFVWVGVDTGWQLEDTLFKIYGTGDFLPKNPMGLTYIGTVQLNGSVWHVFYEDTSIPF